MSTVQLILRNCEISSVNYQNVQYSADFAKLRNEFSLLFGFPPVQLILRNQFSLLSGFPSVLLILRNCEIAKSVQLAIRISNVQLILRNCEISSVNHQNVQCSVDFAKLRNQYRDFPCSVDFCEIAKSAQFTIRMSIIQLSLLKCERNQFSLLSGFPLFS